MYFFMQLSNFTLGLKVSMIHQSIATIFFTLLLLTTIIPGVSANTEGDALTVFKHSLYTPHSLYDSHDVFESWNATLPDPCSWMHVTCNTDNSVTEVDLGYAYLFGQLVPELGQLPNLQHLVLNNNNIAGEIPSELGNLTNLVSLVLHVNNLRGHIPDSFGKLQKLSFLRLNNNTLTGEIPVSLTTISTLRVLDLSSNQLTGKIPINGSFQLFDNASFANNPLEPSLPEMRPTRQSPQDGNIFVGAIAGGVAAGAILLISIPAIVFWWYRRRKPHDHSFDASENKDLKLHLGQLKRFSLQEIQVATDNFSTKNILGKGGFGNVYKGQLADGSLVAVKRMKSERTQVGEKQFLTELQMISLAVHQNLLRLQGFCMTPTERLLVYPFMANGSVESQLRERVASQPPLDWATRKYIALGSARGLAYLHDSNPKIIHRDIKAANVLLDDIFEVVVGDFGLAKLMNFQDTHVMTAVRGTIGHIPPECFSTGKSSEKTDVYGYGAMLLELITGQRATDLARIAIDGGVMLLDWVMGILQDKKLENLVGADIEGNYVDEEVEQLIQVALLCMQSNPAARPQMSEVVRMLEGKGLAERWEEWQKKETCNQVISHKQHQHQHQHQAINSFSNIQADMLSGPR